MKWLLGLLRRQKVPDVCRPAYSGLEKSCLFHAMNQVPPKSVLGRKPKKRRRRPVAWG